MLRLRFASALVVLGVWTLAVKPQHIKAQAAAATSVSAPNSSYQQAQAAAQKQDYKAALRFLEQAVKQGFFSAEDLQNDDDLSSLNQQPEWNKLLAQARTKQQRHEARFNQHLVTLLRKIRQQDQQYRVEGRRAERQFGPDSPQARAASAKEAKMDAQLIRQVDSLIAQHGYPGKSLVGEYLKTTAFLVIQHSPDEKYLSLLTATADKGELPWSSLALLIDRLKTEKSEKQVYGSQSHIWPDGRKQLYPIEDEHNVNIRRAKIGMEPLEQYLQRYDITYRVPTATHNPNPPELYVNKKAKPEEHEVSPVELIGGNEALYARLQYPDLARKHKVVGQVTLQMRIDAQGVPQDVVVVKGLGSGCDEEALRVMRAARFTNARKEDHEIRMQMPFPYTPNTQQSSK